MLAKVTCNFSSSKTCAVSLRVMCHWLSVLAKESVARQPARLTKKVRGLNINSVAVCMSYTVCFSLCSGVG